MAVIKVRELFKIDFILWRKNEGGAVKGKHMLTC
jgi:hypothetical protein